MPQVDLWIPEIVLVIAAEVITFYFTFDKRILKKT